MPRFNTIKNLFKKFPTYGKAAMNKTKIYTTQKLNSLKNVTRQNLGRGSKIGLSEAGVSSGKQLREKLLGLNVGIVDPNFRPMIKGVGHTSNKMGKTIGRRIWDMTGRNYAAQAAVGATAMAGVAIMNGGMSQAQDIMYERYMRDSRYSSRLLNKAGLGKSVGNSPLNLGNSVGLSLALSKTRHGY